MAFVATIRVTFTPDVTSGPQAQSEASRVQVAIEENPMNANLIAATEVVKIEKA